MSLKKNSTKSIDFQVNGGKKLSGSIVTNFSKNGSVGLLCASLLNSGTTTLRGIARIEEVYRVIEILESIGVKIKWIKQNTLVIGEGAAVICIENGIKIFMLMLIIFMVSRSANLFVGANGWFIRRGGV